MSQSNRKTRSLQVLRSRNITYFTFHTRTHTQKKNITETEAVYFSKTYAPQH
jgi:hypothetical protein